jgi:hypothetical protein
MTEIQDFYKELERNVADYTRKTDDLDIANATRNSKLKKLITKFTEKTKDELTKYISSFQTIFDAFTRFSPISTTKMTDDDGLNIETYGIDNNNTDVYLQNVLNEVRLNDPAVKPKHIKNLFYLIYYNKCIDTYNKLNINITALAMAINTFNTTNNPTNLITLKTQLQTTIELGIFYSILYGYFTQMMEDSIALPILAIMVDLINKDTTVSDFKRACNRAFHIIHNNEPSIPKETLDKYYGEFKYDKFKPLFLIDSNINTILQEEVAQKNTRDRAKETLDAAFTAYTAEQYYIDVLEDYSISAGGAPIRFDNNFIKQAINTGIIAFKLAAINRIKTNVGLAVAAQVTNNMTAGLLDRDYRVHEVKMRTFNNTKANLAIDDFELQISKAIIIDYLTTSFNLSDIVNVHNATVLRLIDTGIKAAANVNALYNGYDAIFQADQANNVSRNTAQPNNSLLTPIAMFFVYTQVNEIINLLLISNRAINERINSDILNPELMSEVNTIIDGIVNTWVVVGRINNLFLPGGGGGKLYNMDRGIQRVFTAGGGAVIARFTPQFEAVFKDYAINVAKAHYSEMTIKFNDIDDTEPVISQKIIEMRTDRTSINQVLLTANGPPVNDKIKEAFNSLFTSVFNYYYLQNIGSNTFVSKGTIKSRAPTKQLKNNLSDPFDAIHDIIKNYEDNMEELDVIKAIIKDNQDEYSTRKVEQNINKLKRLGELFTKIIKLPLVVEDNELHKFVRKQITILNGIIEGDSFNKHNYLKDDSEEDDEDDEDDSDSSAKKKETTAKKDKSLSKDSKTAEAIETKFFEEIDKFIKQFKTLDEASIKQIMKHILSIDYPDEEFFKPIADKCFNLDGKECVELISACSRGDLSCIDRFQKLDFSKDIDIATIPIKLALDFAKTIGFYDKSVDDFYKAYKEKYTTGKSSGKYSGKSPDLHADVLKVFRAIKRKIDLFERKSTVCEIKLETKKRSPQMLLRHVASMTGGGNKNKNNYNDYIMNLNALKNNLSMSGGAGNTYSIFLDELELLKQLLKEQGKEIDSNSEVAIKDMIEKIHKYENRLKEMKKLTIGLIHILENTDYKISEDKGKILTIDALKLIHKEQEKIKSKNSRKAFQLVGLLGSVPYPLFPAGYS